MRFLIAEENGNHAAGDKISGSLLYVTKFHCHQIKRGDVVRVVANTCIIIYRFDADGNAHIYEVLAPVGQKLEGEIEEDDLDSAAVVTEPAAAPGTVVEGVGVVNAEGLVVANDLLATPTKKKPLPPRRKKKGGPGRGKKGPIALREAMERGEISAETPTSAAFLGVPGANASDEATSAAASTQGDTPMPDAQDGDEGSSEEGEEGDDDVGSEEGELAQSPDHTTSNAALHEAAEPAPVKTEEATLDPSHPPPHLIPPAIEINRDASSSPDLPLASRLTNQNSSLAQPPTTESIPAESAQFVPGDVHSEEGEVDVFGSLERHLENETEPAPEA